MSTLGTITLGTYLGPYPDKPYRPRQKAAPKTYDLQAIYDYIVAYKRQHDGNSPSIRNIQQEIGIGSTGTTFSLLQCLEKSGKIRLPPFGTARGIEVIGGKWIQPEA